MSKGFTIIELLMSILAASVLCLILWASLASKPSQTSNGVRWYGEYCNTKGNYCEFRNGEGNVCPIQVNDKDPLTSVDMRLREGSCQTQ